MAPRRYYWDAKNGKILDKGDPPMSAIVLKEFVTAKDEVDAMAKGLVEALKELRATPNGKIFSDLLSDPDYRAEFDEALSDAQWEGVASSIKKWRDDYVFVLVYMFKAMLVILREEDAVPLITATMVYELFVRPALERILRMDLPPAWRNPRLKHLMTLIQAEAQGQQAKEVVLPEFRRYVRSVLAIVNFIDLLRSITQGPDPFQLFIFGFDESAVMNVGIYRSEWYNSLTGRAALVAELMMQMNGQPGEQGATLGYWMGATIMNTIRAGIEELIRFKASIG